MTMAAEHIPRIGWRLLRLPPQLFYALGLGFLQGQLVLLLITTGRKSGRRHVTPLQYEEENGLFHVMSARGPEADWYRNILADPRVEVQVKSRRFVGNAKPVTDTAHIARNLQRRLQHHPRLVGAILRAEGLPTQPSLADLERYATGLTMVIIRPVTMERRSAPSLE